MKFLGQGTGCSLGRAEGTARVITSEAQVTLFQAGEILVCTTTNPAYVSALMKAAGVVTEYGGVCSHAAIVSREFEIPCVVGVKNVTSEIKNGEKIVVDGNDGKIFRVD